MKKKLIKKCQQGATLIPAWTAQTFDDLPTRKYYWRQWTPEMKIKTDYYTGEPLNENWKVLVDDQGNVVDTDDPQVQADYAALSGSSNFTAVHPGVTFTFDKNSNQKFVQPTTETADERIERLSNAPIATQEQWEQIKQKEDEDRQEQTPEGHKIWLRQKDAEANAKTPGVGMLFAAPVALGVGAAVTLSNPLAFVTSLGGAKIGEATLNYPFQQQGYQSFGDWWLGPNASDAAKETVNLGTWLGGGLGWSAANQFLNKAENVGINYFKQKALNQIKNELVAREYSKYPQVVEDVVASELASSNLKNINITKPGVFYSKIGETNKGSLISKVKDGISNLFRNDPVWNFMERTGIPEEQRAVVEKVIIKPSLDPNKNWYTDPWSNITYAIKTPQATDEELMSQFAIGLTSRFKQYKTDPQLKAAIQQEMDWDDETYNNFLKEITKKILEENSIGVSGKEELSGNLARTTHLKIENPDQPTRYATEYLINRDRIAGESNNLQEELQYSKEAGIHEGYHGITSGIDGEKDAIEKGIQNEYPLITQLMERNNQFLQSVAETQEWYNYFNNTPVYKIVSDLEASGFTPEQIEYVTEFGLPRAKSYNHYVLQPQETSARDIVATTLGPGTKNEEQLRNIYTPESFNQFHGKLLSRIGEVNEGSATGAIDIKNFLNQIRKARRTVEEYLGSEKHVKQIMKSGVSKKEAQTIANEMKNNALKVKHRFSTQEGMDSSYERRPKENGKISPGITIGKDSPDIEAAVYHEYGGHAATLGLLGQDLEKRATTAWDNDFSDKYWTNILRQSPHLLEINRHNLSLKPVRLPKYQVPDSELSENDKFWLDYFENVDEYSTIARAANIGKGNYHAENDFIDLMKEYFTPESIENLQNLVWSKAGELNKGSAVGASRRPILRKNMHEFSDAEWDAAYEAALEKGNKREMWRLLTLRFQQKAKEYIANGGDPKLLYRGDWRDYFLNFKKDGVWLSSDPLYALNFTEDRISKDHILFPSKVRKYFVKGTSEQLLPKNVYQEISSSLPKSDYYWDPITSYLMFGVPDELRRFPKIVNAENNLLKLIGKAPKELTAAQKKAYRLGSADVIVGQDSPVYEYPNWHISQGLEYYVANPNYVKSANLITYDDNGNMIPLSQRFNFGRNDRRYSWLLPLIPFLQPNKKDQAD